MKATELMIGDWAYIKEYPMISEAKRVTASHFTRSLCEFEPIPLTEDILKANELYDCGEFYDGWNFDLTDNKKNTVSVGCIWFVHELQHALRLCGLNGLADNFIIAPK